MSDKKISQLTAAGAITGSEMVELVQSGSSVRSTVDGIKNGAVKVYRALLTQSGTNAPVAVILENTLGAVPVWGYGGVGYYTLTLAGAFPDDKTLFFMQKIAKVTSADFSVFFDTSPDIIGIETGRLVAGVFQAQDGKIDSPTPFEISVYP